MSVRRRQQPVRASGSTVTVLLAASVALTAFGACSGEARSAAAPTTVTRAVTTTTTTAALAPVDGELRVRIDGGARTSPTRSAGVDDVLLVGDSVLVLVADELAALTDATLHIDAADCRTLATDHDGGCGEVPAGVTVDSGITATRAAVDRLGSRWGVPDVAVFVLANNSTVEPADVDELLALTAEVERVWLVNTRIDGFGRQDPNNRVLAAAAADPRVGIVDWHGASEGRDLLADHVHPDDRGQRELARLIADAVECGCDR